MKEIKSDMSFFSFLVAAAILSTTAAASEGKSAVVKTPAGLVQGSRTEVSSVHSSGVCNLTIKHVTG